MLLVLMLVFQLLQTLSEAETLGKSVERVSNLSDSGGQSPVADVENVEFIGHIGGSTKAVFVEGNYAYIGESGHLTVLNISNPTVPTVEGRTSPLPGMVYDVYISGGYAYIANYGSGLRVVDVSDPANPTEVGRHYTSNAHSVFVSGNNAYVVDWLEGLRILDVSDPTNPIEVGFYTPVGARDVYVLGGIAYVASVDGLTILRYTGGRSVYTISGHIQDSRNNPIAGVTVSAGTNGSAATNTNGAYTITGLVTGTYILTPMVESSAKMGWMFTPPTRTVSVPPDATGQDFTLLPLLVSATLEVSGTISAATRLIYTDTQGNLTTLDFPAGAVTKTTEVRFTPVSSPIATSPPGLMFFNHAFDIMAYWGGVPISDLTFELPVTITIHYSKDDVSKVDESSLTLYHWDGNRWVDAATTCDPDSVHNRHPAENWFMVSICHLSHWGAFAKPVAHPIYLPLVLRIAGS